jgi:hypothetical protein
MADSAVLQYAQIAKEAAAQYHEDPALLLADIQEESGGNPLAVSSAGARGLTQFIPSTAAEYGVKYGSSAADVRSQIFGQAHYLAALGVNSNPTAALESYSGNTPGYASTVKTLEKAYEGLVTGGVEAGASPEAVTGGTGAGGSEPKVTSEGLLGLGEEGMLYVALVLAAVGLIWFGTKSGLGPAPKGAR